MEAGPGGSRAASRRARRRGAGDEEAPAEAPRSAPGLPIIRRARVDSGGGGPAAGSGFAGRQEEERCRLGKTRSAPATQWALQDNKHWPANNGPLFRGPRSPGAVGRPEIRSQRGKKQRRVWGALLLLIACELAAQLGRQTCLSSLSSGAGDECGAPASFELLHWPRAGPIVLYAHAAEASLQSVVAPPPPTATAAPIIERPQSMDTNSNNNETKTTTTTTTTTTNTTSHTSTAASATELNATSATSTMASPASTAKHDHHAPANDINKHRQAGRAHGGPASVVCNSRCRCVLMEPHLAPPAAAHLNDTGAATGNHSASSRISQSSAVAFGEDYSLEDADDDSAAALAAGSPDEPASSEDEPLPRGLLMGGAEASAGLELSAGSSASKKSSTVTDMRQMFRLVLPDKQPAGHQAAPGAGSARQQAAAVQLYAQAFHSKQAAPAPLKLSPYLSSAHQVPPGPARSAAPQDGVSPLKHIKSYAPPPPPPAAAARWPPLAANARLVELRALDASGRFSDYSLELETRPNGTRRPSRALVNSTRHLLQQLEEWGQPEQQPEALSLRGSNMSFELWCELYALLAPHFRRRIYQLDLSHNGLPKLGLTFTGFIEHQLVALNGSWPGNQNQPQSATRTGSGGPASMGGGPVAAARPKQLLSSGLLYELVVAETNLSSHYYASHSHQSTESQLPSHHNNNNNNKLVVQETARSVKSQILTQPIQIRALDLSHNKIKWLINDQFRALKHVQAIRLDHNRIRYIHRHAFSGLESLRYLNLNSNRLQVIYTEQFQTNYKLLAIRLRNNYLAYLRGGSFTSLSNLRRLDVSQNKLTLVSANAFVGLESLEHLNCSSNQFLQVPSTSLHPLISLRQLDFSNNLLGQLMPGAFFHLPIVELLLQNNSQLSDIERGAFWDLPYLRQLRLSGNPSLVSINSQAFVGTPNLCIIEADQCPLLEPQARQLLENTTTGTLMRLLRLQMLTQGSPTDSITAAAAGQHQPLNSSAAAAATTQPVQQAAPASSVQSPQQAATNSAQQELTPAHLLAVVAPAASLASQKYLYFVASVALLAVAIKLLFKYTASSRYLSSVRQRRRVYEANAELAELSLALPALDQHHSLSTARRPSVIPAASSSPSSSCTGAQQQQQPEHCAQQEPAGQPAPQSVDISVISDSMCEYLQQQPLQMHNICSQCPLPGCQGSTLDQMDGMLEGGPCGPEVAHDEPQVAPEPSLDLIQSQLLAAGYECGHANCTHFYQSLAPALHLAADLAAGTDYC